MSLAYIPGLMAAMSGVPQEQAGLASGIVTTTYQVGSAPGLAALTALATSRGAGRPGDLPALTDGFSAAFTGAAGVAAAGALLTALFMAAAAAARRPAPPVPGRTRTPRWYAADDRPPRRTTGVRVTGRRRTAGP